MEIHKIIVATDFSDTSLRALETALNLALETGGTLYLVHVMDPSIPVGPMAGPVLQPGTDDHDKLSKKLESLIPANWEQDVEVKTELLAGNPADAVAEFAEEVDADMIVVGTHGRKGLARVLMGSTAESLLRRAPCQVLVVKPKLSAREKAAEE